MQNCITACYPNYYYCQPCYPYWYHRCGCNCHCYGGCGCHQPAPRVTVKIEHVVKMLEPPKKKLEKKKSFREW